MALREKLDCELQRELLVELRSFLVNGCAFPTILRIDQSLGERLQGPYGQALLFSLFLPSYLLSLIKCPIVYVVRLLKK